ncbi:bifunctional phosphoribosylaminoimidazolecarboxamide formyltransferase/IMP cyclohydrolase [bacterium]
MKRALISVSDKTGLIPFVKELDSMGVDLISTGGTRKFIESEEISVKDISEFTGSPEILNGRVKTLHPKVHGGILAQRSNPEHQVQVKENDINYIDMVVVNLYPFDMLLKKEGVSEEEMIENIDIGGPSMIRSSAKNFKDVVVVCDVNDYSDILDALKKDGDLSLDARKKLAAKVFAKTSYYDSLIFNYLEKETQAQEFTTDLEVNLSKVQDLRYGENPHQKAAYYKIKENNTNFSWHKIGGKELSYNNFLDLEAAWNMAVDFEKPTCVIVKHSNPCGIGQHDKIEEAYKKALSTDSVSAFGGIVAINQKVTKEAAIEITKIFTECVIAPDYDDDAIEIFKSKKNLRIIKVHGKVRDTFELKRVFDGCLVQEKDNKIFDKFEVVTKTKLEDNVKDALLFGWTVSKHVKSNAIVLASHDQTVGVGAGQMSRVDAAEVAIKKAQNAKLEIKGSILASDAFFPFRDSIDAAAKYGIKAIIQPGGSVRDQEVINACDEYGIAMVFTGMRHFRH